MHLVERFRINERASVVASALLVGAMLVCASAPIIQFAQRVVPGWDGSYLLAVCFLVALEALWSKRLTDPLSFPSGAWFAARLTEFVVILLSVKLVLYTQRGWAQLWADVPRWQANFDNFFDAEYSFGAALVLGVWLVSTWFAGPLSELEGDERLLEPDSPRRSDRHGARQQLMEQIGIVGGVMFLFTLLVRTDLKVVGVQSPLIRASLLNVVLYFVLGLVLLSQSQFAILRARWSLERVPLRGNLAWRWAGYSLALLAGVAVLASFLPTRYSLGFLDTIGFLLSALYAIFLLLVIFIAAVVTIFIQWLAHWLGLQIPPGVVRPPAPVLPPPGSYTPTGSLSWLDVLKSLLFWLVFLSVLGYSLYYYLRQRQDVLPFLRRVPGWAWLTQWWRTVSGHAKAFRQDFAAAWQKRRQARSSRSADLWHYLGLGRLSPRDRVRFFYLALVRRASESGLPRRPGQTPVEYEHTLSQVMPLETSEDVSALTEAFSEARYSPHEIPPGLAQQVREHWDRLRRALRRWRDGNDAP